MRTGDHINAEDYVAFYNDRIRAANKKHGWAFVAVLLAIVAGAILLNGCDYQAAQATEEAVQASAEKKLAVMGMPCTWVAQCGNPISDCPVKNRQCTNADLRSQ